MGIFTEVTAQLTQLRVTVGDPATDLVPAVVRELHVGVARDVIVATAAIMRQLTVLQSCAAGVVAEHSRREAGHDGFVQRTGHRTPASLVQEITGSTRADAVKQIRVGEALFDAVTPPSGGDAAGGSECEDADSAQPWHAPLGAALLAGRISSDQHDAIRRGLGEPPVDGSAPSDVRAAAVEAWRTAAEQLVDEASERTVEELRGTARAIRDLLDPKGAAVRFDERFERRSFRTWTDRDGVHRAAIAFDDETAAWVRAIIDAALRPRRGGPRFVDAAEAAAATRIEKDPRTNDQLTYDLIVDVLRAGALADAEAVFGTRQAGVRVVVSASALRAVDGDTAGGQPAGDAVGHCEDGGQALPAWLIAQRACDVGQSTLTVDQTGNPLYLGRESRLFSAKQKVALAVRDGGCRWRGCDRPASYCEAHHIDHFAEQGGRTDIDRGILLCRWHHMQLHHGGWSITRSGLGDFVLHPPGRADPIVLRPRLALQYAWRALRPPGVTFRPAA